MSSYIETIEIPIRAKGGVSMPHAIAGAISLAGRLNCDVRLDWNGTQVAVRPQDDAQKVYEGWLEAAKGHHGSLGEREKQARATAARKEIGKMSKTLAKTDPAVGNGSAPHGQCECRDGCQCAILAGPAAYEVTRDARRLKVCTRCTLPHDSDRRLLVTKKDLGGVYLNYDPRGFMLIVLALATRTEDAAEPKRR